MLDTTQKSSFPHPLIAMLLCAMAGGMGWGIRGQYGHETGAMIAGVLVGLVLVFLFCPRISSLQAARAVAMVALGISFGGSMTYGLTVGLTHNAPLIGNGEALRWGLLGLFIKGSLWIGFAGLFLGIGLSKKRYSAWELTALLCVSIVLLLGGIELLNRPFDPENRLLPKISFSDHWRWIPGSVVKPRSEHWGGLLFALIGLWLYVSLIKRDALARQLTLWGALAGGIGFAGGQCVQATHAWYPPFFDEGWLKPIASHINWWNAMETSFGCLFGAVLALGVWRNRQRLVQSSTKVDISLTPTAEIILLVIHVAAVVTESFIPFEPLQRFAGPAITMGILPILGIMAGRWWPYAFALPIVAIPIAGKTLKELAYKHDTIPDIAGICVYLLIPLFLVTSVAIKFAKDPAKVGLSFSRWSLVLMVWVYFLLNWAFFRFPWPWEPWTFRTPSGLVFVFFASALTVAAWLLNRSLPDTVVKPTPKRTRPTLPWEKAPD